jgi:hypothetical protein
MVQIKIKYCLQPWCYNKQPSEFILERFLGRSKVIKTLEKNVSLFLPVTKKSQSPLHNVNSDGKVRYMDTRRHTHNKRRELSRVGKVIEQLFQQFLRVQSTFHCPPQKMTKYVIAMKTLRTHI